MKKMTKIGLMIAVAMVVAQSKADVSCTWNAASTPETLGNGALTFSYENGCVKTIEFDAEGESVSLSGDMMTFASDASVCFLSGGTFTFNNNIAGAGNSLLLQNRSGTLTSSELDIVREGKVNTDAKFLFQRNMSLSMVTNLSAKLYYYTLVPNSQTFFFANDGQRVTCTIEGVYEGRTVGVKAWLTQEGNDVFLQTPACYVGKKNGSDITEFPHEFVSGGGYAFGDPSYIYLGDIVVNCSADPRIVGDSKLIFAGESASNGGNVIVDGTSSIKKFCVSADNIAAFPPESCVDVFGAMTTIDFNAGTISSGVSPTVVFNVHTGAVLRTMVDFAIGMSGPKVILDGGSLLHGPSTGSYAYGNSIYLPYVEFWNGSTLSRNVGGKDLAINEQDAVWMVRGNKASRVDDLSLTFRAATYRTDGTFAKFVLDVDDVTGDDNVDFYLDMSLVPHISGKYGSFKKIGMGTVRATKPITFVESVSSIAQGSLALGANGVLASAMSLNFKGGSLVSDPACTNAFHGLFVGADTAISIGDRAELACLRILNLGTNGDIDLTLGEGAVFRVGNNRSLTNMELSHITVNGLKARQLDDGSIVAKAPGFLLYFR